MKLRDRIQTRRDRWPTCKGENPPAGLRYRAVYGFGRRWAFEFRVWRWRA